MLKIPISGSVFYPKYFQFSGKKTSTFKTINTKHKIFTSIFTHSLFKKKVCFFFDQRCMLGFSKECFIIGREGKAANEEHMHRRNSTFLNYKEITAKQQTEHKTIIMNYKRNWEVCTNFLKNHSKEYVKWRAHLSIHKQITQISLPFLLLWMLTCLELQRN